MNGHVHGPDAGTIVVHTMLPASSLIITVAPGSPLPMKVGVGLVVVPPVVGEVTVGAAGAVVSITTLATGEGVELIPEVGLDAVAVKS